MQREKILIVALFFLTVSFFFYPIYKGYIPFPGDLLVGGYQPYKSYSYLGYAPGGVPNKGQGPDVLRIMYPWKYFAMEQLKRGELPLWNPYNFSGNTHLANSQSATFYPISVFFFMMSALSAWTVYVFLIPFLSAVFTYVFLREIKLSRLASFLGGICFAFSGFMVVWLQYGDFGHTFLWLPLVLFLINRYIQKPRLIYLLFITFSLTFSLFAGYIQLAIYLCLFVVAFCFYHFLERNERRKYRKYSYLFVALVFPFFLAALQIFPLVEIFTKSARIAYGFDQLSERLIPPQNLVTIFFPDFFGNPATRNYWLPGTYIERAGYIGVMPLVFVFFAWFARKIRYTTFFFATAFISYLSTLDLLPVKFLHGLGIPILSTGVPSRVLAAFCFSMAVLAAIGFDYWIKNINKNKFIKPFGLLLFFVASVWIFVLLQQNDSYLVTKRNLILPTGIFVVMGVLMFLRKCIPMQIIALSFVAITVVDLFFFFHKITPFSPRAFIYPKTTVMEKLRSIQGIDRSWGYGEGFIDSELQIMEEIYSTNGYGPLFIKRYAELVSLSENGKIPDAIDRTNVTLAHGYGPDDLRSNQHRQRLLNLLGVKYLLHRYIGDGVSFSHDKQTFPENTYKLVWQADGWQIYRNNSALPRVFLTTDYVVKQDKDIVHALLSKEINLRDTIVLESKPSFASKPRVEKSASVVVGSYKPNSVVLRTKSRDDSLLFLSDNYFPGWKASIGEKDVTIYRANYAFRAVEVPKGTHDVVFRYEPESFRYGILVSGIAFVVLFLVMLGARMGKIHVL